MYQNKTFDKVVIDHHEQESIMEKKMSHLKLATKNRISNKIHYKHSFTH